ncbi:amidase family protein [Congregibacter sp.]|uniref:amidase family protein n=1 Tax=Congregibacter sp. TaxID=2744308 RepID=UPI003F6C6294
MHSHLPRHFRLPLHTLCLLALLFTASASRAAELELTSATIAELNAAMDAEVLSSEQLVRLYLDRITAYDQQGPALNTVMLLNPAALERARALDVERKTRGRRSPLHGIPVLIKDNLDTGDMPTTAGSFLLEGSVPPDDAFVVQKLRDAGAIILGKLNLSEFASGGSMNSLGGVIANPHHLGRTPSGSSGGTGAAIAAGFASLGLGTDTGGSVRGPSSANGIVGLKTTHGLVSRDGVIPLALSFDTVGPMTRSVTDLALSLGVMAGVDPADDSTQKSVGKSYGDYSQFLDGDALKGARIGVARVFMGDDGEVDWLVESALQSMRDAGAEIVDVEFPDWLLESRGKFYRAIRYPEFKAQIADYLATLDEDYPKDLEALISRAMTLNAKRVDGVIPNPSRWSLMQKEVEASGLDGYEYEAVKAHALPLITQTIEGLMGSHSLDAIVYPTSSTPADLVEQPAGTSEPGSGGSPVILANLSGLPDLILPIGFTGRGMPVTLSFMGRAFGEPRLIGLGYALEQRLQAIRMPVHTPPLAGGSIRYD